MQFGNCRRRHRIEIDDSVASDSELEGKLEHLEKITVCSSWQASVELATLNEMCTKYSLNPAIISTVTLMDNLVEISVEHFHRNSDGQFNGVSE